VPWFSMSKYFVATYTHTHTHIHACIMLLMRKTLSKGESTTTGKRARDSSERAGESVKHPRTDKRTLPTSYGEARGDLPPIEFYGCRPDSAYISACESMVKRLFPPFHIVGMGPSSSHADMSAADQDVATGEQAKATVEKKTEPEQATVAKSEAVIQDEEEDVPSASASASASASTAGAGGGSVPSAVDNSDHVRVV
jgi:hypothetical protein